MLFVEIRLVYREDRTTDIITYLTVNLAVAAVR